MIRFLLVGIIACGVWNCSPVSQRALTRKLKTAEVNFNDHIGFMAYDPERSKTLVAYKSAQYFTPGSNTKIFTFFASLKMLGDSIPALRFYDGGDSLIFWGTGDPSLLYTNTFSNDTVLNFLKAASLTHRLFFSSSNFQTEFFGRGWAWDDFNDYYSPERSPLPMYGNIVSVSGRKEIHSVNPAFFSKNVFPGEPLEKPSVTRDPASNLFTFHPGFSLKRIVQEVPFKTSPELTCELLTDTLKTSIQLMDTPFRSGAKYIYSIPSDSLYKVMMQESDNFVAEQLLLLCANAVSDTLKPEIAINYVIKKWLQDAPDKPVWIDGSGLSRYNLFTPRTMVYLWQKIYSVVPRERLFSLLARGGKPGTLKNYFQATDPYVFGKTGSLSNNHCLSGFMVTKKKHTIIFSFMNSNFTKPVSEVRSEMESILKIFYEKY